VKLTTHLQLVPSHWSICPLFNRCPWHSASLVNREYFTYCILPVCSTNDQQHTWSSLTNPDTSIYCKHCCHMSNQYSHQTISEGKNTSISFFLMSNNTNQITIRYTYAIASIMSRPISTVQWAWSERGSGRPDTQ
jgi:hypothetical protein